MNLIFGSQEFFFFCVWISHQNLCSAAADSMFHEKNNLFKGMGLQTKSQPSRDPSPSHQQKPTTYPQAVDGLSNFPALA
jgi:hypothetical protein